MVHLTEIRIVMPFTVEEFKRGQRYANWKTNENATTEPGQGGTLLSSTPYYHEVYGEGIFTHSLFKLGNRLPDWVNRLVPPSALVIDEKSWIVYPYMRTVITIPFFSRLKMEIVSIHKDDDGNTENALGLSEEELAIRKIDYMDLGSEKVAARDYYVELDPLLVQPKSTGRGPLTPGWQYREKTLMCAYKVVRAEANYWGLATRAEKLLINSLRQIFLLAHKNCFGLTDEWYHLTYEQVMALDLVTQERLNLAKATISGPDTAQLEGGEANDGVQAEAYGGVEKGGEEEEEEEEDYEDLDIEFYEAEMQWSLEEELYGEQMLSDGLGSKRYGSGTRSPLSVHLSPAAPVPALCPLCAAGPQEGSVEGGKEPALFCTTCSEFYCAQCFTKFHCTPRLASHEAQGIEEYKEGNVGGAGLVNGVPLEGEEGSKSEKGRGKEWKLIAKEVKREGKEQGRREKRERREQERRAKEEEKERERERKVKEKEKHREEEMIAKEMRQAKHDVRKEQKQLLKTQDGTSSPIAPSPIPGPELNPAPPQPELLSTNGSQEADQLESTKRSAESSIRSDWAGMKNPPVNVPGIVRATSANRLDEALSTAGSPLGKPVLGQRSLSSKHSLQMNDEHDPFGGGASGNVALSADEALQLNNEFRGRHVELSQAILSEILQIYRSSGQGGASLTSSATSSLSSSLLGDRHSASAPPGTDAAAPDAINQSPERRRSSGTATGPSAPSAPSAPATAAAVEVEAEPADRALSVEQAPDVGAPTSTARNGRGSGSPAGSPAGGWGAGLLEFHTESLEPLLASMSHENLRPASRFRALTEMLKEAEPATLSHDEKVVFWINVYNALGLHGFLVYGIPKSHYKRVMFLNKVSYVIGGMNFSLLSIEHSVLRAASHRPALAGLLPVQRFKAGDPAFACILTRPEPLVTFALSCGSRSSPPIQVYSLQKLREQLDDATSWYLSKHVDLSSPGKVVLPKLLQWYGKDFAPSTGRLLKWIALRLPADKKEELESRMKRKSKEGVAWEGGSKAVQVSVYDWTFVYLLGQPQELI